jgi:hypothetical protein
MKDDVRDGLRMWTVKLCPVQQNNAKLFWSCGQAEIQGKTFTVIMKEAGLIEST